MDLLLANYEKFLKSCRLVQDSLCRLVPLDPSFLDDSLAMEPYDALASRFERFVEIAINRFFRSVELYQFAEGSESIRDRLLKMEKIGLVSSVDLWMEMRDFRNRIAHDYLPEQLIAIFNGIRNRFDNEITRCARVSAEFMLKYKERNRVPS